jgi:uncharacterized membrane protein YfhO
MFYSAKTIENDSLIATYMNDKNFNYARELVLSEKPQLNNSDTGDVKNNINITKYTNNKIEINVSTDKPGLLWLSEIWYPAWKAKVDGKVTKVYKADFSFRAIDVPSGNHKITMYFDSDAFRYGMIISLTALFASICIIGFNFRQFSLPKKTV